MCALATLLLWEAVDRGDLSAVRRLVGRVPDLDARHSMVCLSGPSAPRDSELTALLHCQSDYTALSIAAARGYTNILLLLLRAGANPLAKAPVVRCVHLLGRVLRALVLTPCRYRLRRMAGPLSTALWLGAVWMPRQLCSRQEVTLCLPTRCVGVVTLTALSPPSTH